MFPLVHSILALALGASAEYQPALAAQRAFAGSPIAVGTSLQDVSVPTIGALAQGCESCSSKDSLAPYREIYASALPLKLEEITQKRELFLANRSEQAAVVPAAFLAGLLPRGHSALFFDLGGLLPRAWVGTVHESCVRDAFCWSPDIRADAVPLVQEAGALIARMPLGPKHTVRYTFRKLGQHIIALGEICEDGVNWREGGYYFADTAKHAFPG